LVREPRANCDRRRQNGACCPGPHGWNLAESPPRHSRVFEYLRPMSGHDHHHDHDHSDLSETELRVRALESILTEKGYVDPTSLDLLIDLYEKKIGPRNGIRVVAKAWADPAYRERLLTNATS